MEDDCRHDVFLSSARFGLEHIRSVLAAWLDKQGYNAFVFETFKDQDDWAVLLPAKRQAICLDHVAGSRLYVGIFRSTYGSSGEDHVANIAFTDLELFEAFRARVPMLLYVLADLTPDPRLAALLRVVEAVLPGALIRIANEAELVTRVERDIDIHFGRRSPISVSSSRFDRFRRALILHRKVDDDQREGLRFLYDRYPTPQTPFDPDLVRAALNEIPSIKSYHARINATYLVLDRLFNVPWYRTHTYLDLWDEALEHWETTAAWLGLHGFVLSGRLAADNTLVAIRVLRASAGELASIAELLRKGETHTGTHDEWIRLYATGGALASEYYSIAKLAPPAWKTHYLAKANGWIDVAEQTFARDTSCKREAGLASLRGHIFLEWGRVSEAIPLLERSLHLREDAALGPASIGEAQVDLGYGYVLAGRKRSGERLIESGLALLELHGTPGFVARAKRKAARVFVQSGAFGMALRQLVDVKYLVDTYGLDDQGRESAWLSKLPKALLEALRTPSSRGGS